MSSVPRLAVLFSIKFLSAVKSILKLLIEQNQFIVNDFNTINELSTQINFAAASFRIQGKSVKEALIEIKILLVNKFTMQYRNLT